MFNKEEKNPSHYEITLSIAKVRFERDAKVIEGYVEEVTLDMVPEERDTLSAVYFLLQGSTYARNELHGFLSNSDPSEHRDLNTIDSIVRGLFTLAERLGLPTEDINANIC